MSCRTTLKGGAKKKMRIRKFIRNKKAISPIFASLILIAIAVIAGIVVYMFTSGTIATMTGGGTAGQEKVAVTTVAEDGTTAGLLHIWAKSTGGTEVTIDGAILKDSGGSTLEVKTLAGTTLPAAGTLTSVDAGFAPTNIVNGQTYTVTLTSVDGGSFVSAAFKP